MHLFVLVVACGLSLRPRWYLRREILFRPLLGTSILGSTVLRRATPPIIRWTYLGILVVCRLLLFKVLAPRSTAMFIVDALSFTRVASPGSGFSGMTVPGGTSGGVGKAAKFVTIYIGVGISVHMSHTCFDLRATTVQEGGLMRSTRVSAGFGQLVDSRERSTTGELAETLNGLEGTFDPGTHTRSSGGRTWLIWLIGIRHDGSLSVRETAGDS